MQLNESQKHYAQLITEELGVKDPQKLNWMAQYAYIHAIHEGIEAGGNPSAMSAGYNAINATPFNTIGAGNPMLPGGNPNAPFDPVNGGAFHDPSYVKGSGDVPMSTLSTALEIAAVTIGFDLVPVVPASGPMVFLTFNDYPYAGGKLGLANETALDGKGNGADNKPIYIKLAVQSLEQAASVAANLNEMNNYTAELTITGSPDNTVKTFEGIYMGTSRIDGGIILQVKSVQSKVGSADAKDCSLSDWAKGSNTVAVTLKAGAWTSEPINVTEWTVTLNKTGEDPVVKTYNHKPEIDLSDTNIVIDGEDTGKAKADWTATTTNTGFCAVVPELVKGVTDHIQSFSNFVGNGKTGSEYAPSDEPMSRAENETGTGNIIGARMFSKLVRMGSYEAVGQVTRQQLQDMPLYGIDVLGGVIETCQNEISQNLNNRILDRVFKLGVENYKIQRAAQGIELNLFISGDTDQTGKKLSDFSGGAPFKKFRDLNGNTVQDVTIKNAMISNSFENVITNQRRIMSRMLAASNVVSSVTRRGRAQWAVTNAQVLTALQDCAQFTPAAMANDLVQGGEESLYFAGTLAGMKIYVDPFMRWNDTRICVGRKATVNNNRVQGSGVVFMPYILADQVQILAEGTMAPKVLINSRFAVVDAGWYPEQNYYCFMVDMEDSNLI